MKKFRVLRQHHGDKEYLAGDYRYADPLQVAHLVAAGVLAEANVERHKEPKFRGKK